jgi:hypothetical protein
MIKRFAFCFFLASARLSTATAQPTIFVVRHAEKADAGKTRIYRKPAGPGRKHSQKR